MRGDQIQRRHYAQTATAYDGELGQTPEHEFALHLSLGLLDSIKAESLLDVGAGTGRALKFFATYRPSLIIRGIEPVEELRAVGYSNGLPREWLVEGSGYNLPFPDRSFDVVTEFGVLHHLERPECVVREMLRVAKYAVFLSDTNNLGQGGLAGRLVKTLFYRLGLWKFLRFIRTGGRGYVFEPNDGLWYYYTIFSHLRELKRSCHSVHVVNTRRSSSSPVFSASHAAIFATKKEALERGAFFAHLK